MFWNSKSPREGELATSTSTTKRDKTAVQSSRLLALLQATWSILENQLKLVALEQIKLARNVQTGISIESQSRAHKTNSWIIVVKSCLRVSHFYWNVVGKTMHGRWFISGRHYPDPPSKDVLPSSSFDKYISKTQMLKNNSYICYWHGLLVTRSSQLKH